MASWRSEHECGNLLSFPLHSLGVPLEEHLRQLPVEGQKAGGGQAARPGPAAPIQGAGTILALGAVVPAKLGWWKFQGLGPGFESRQRLYCEHSWEKGLHHGLNNP